MTRIGKFSECILTITLSILIMFGLLACNSEKPQKAGQEAEVLFEDKCNTCHGSDVAKVERKTAGEWKRTVKRMQGEHGCKITDVEANIIIDYLSKNYK